MKKTLDKNVAPGTCQLPRWIGRRRLGLRAHEEEVVALLVALRVSIFLDPTRMRLASADAFPDITPTVTLCFSLEVTLTGLTWSRSQLDHQD